MLDSQKRWAMLTSSKYWLKLKNTHQGFSLVELMIVVAIIGILATLSLPSYRIWIENSKIRTTAESIHNGLQLARIEAIKRNTQVQFNLPSGQHGGWTVNCVSGCGTLHTRATKEGSSDSINITRYKTGTSGTYNKVVFSALGTVVTVATSFDELEIDNGSLNTADSRDLNIIIGAGGATRVCDPDSGLSTSDPRRC